MKNKRIRLSIRVKLLISYFAIVALIIFVGSTGIYSIHEVYSNGNEIYINNLKSVEFLKSINQNVRGIDQCVISMMSALDSVYHEEYKQEIAELKARNAKLLEDYEKLDVSDLEERRYNQCRLSILTFDKQIEAITESIESGNGDMAVTQYEQELVPAKACTYELLDAMVELCNASAESKNSENHVIYNNIIWLIVLIMAISVVAAITLTVFISTYFTGKLMAIQRLAKRLSQYDVSDDILGMSNDEFGQTMEALNDSQFMIRDLLEKIINESVDISETGEEVSLAVRKSNQRIEGVNVKVYDAEVLTGDMRMLADRVLDNRSLDAESAENIKMLMVKASFAEEELQDVQTELTGIAMYLEQIGITSDYQNEIAGEHKKQMNKFKVSSTV